MVDFVIMSFFGLVSKKRKIFYTCVLGFAREMVFLNIILLNGNNIVHSRPYIHSIPLVVMCRLWQNNTCLKRKR